MARQRTTFGKLQRAADKRERQKLKMEKRQARAEDGDDVDDDAPAPAADQAAVLEEFAALHEAFEDGRIPRDEFESRKELLTRQMVID